MWKAIRYYWTVSRGFRLQPWRSPYLQWRFETFLGKAGADLDARKFFQLSWKYRHQLNRFADWASERRHAQRRRA